MKGNEGTLPLSVLSCWWGVGGMGGVWHPCREPAGRRRPHPLPQVRTREGPSQLLSGTHPPVASLAPLGCWKVSSFLPQL